MDKLNGLSLPEAGLIDESVVCATEVGYRDAVFRQGDGTMSLGRGTVVKLNVAGGVSADDGFAGR